MSQQKFISDFSILWNHEGESIKLPWEYRERFTGRVMITTRIIFFQLCAYQIDQFAISPSDSGHSLIVLLESPFVFRPELPSVKSF